MGAVPSSGECRLTLPCMCLVFCEYREVGTACHVRASGGLQDLEKGDGAQRGWQERGFCQGELVCPGMLLLPQRRVGERGEVCLFTLGQ